jgi:hypothetical protein
MEPIRYPETLVNNYHTTQRNVPEEQRSYQHRGDSLKLSLQQELIKDNYCDILLVIITFLTEI